MLGKLIKYEWRSSWKVIAAMNCFLILMTILGIFSFRSTVLESDIEALNVLGVLTLLFYYLSLVVIGFAVLLFTAFRFQKNLYGDEGYLMHTLPVSPSQHIISKMLIAVLNYTITFIVIILSIMSLAFSLVSSISPDTNISYEISRGWQEILPSLQDAIHIPLWLYAIFLLIGCIVSIFSSILMIFASISIGQLFNRHKVMGSILSYIGLYIFMQTVMSFIAMPQTLSNMVSNVQEEVSISSVLNTTFLSTFIISGIFGVIYYFLTLYLMKKKLNMD